MNHRLATTKKMAPRARASSRSSTKKPKANWLQLPTDLLTLSLQFLPVPSIGAVPQACKQWRDALAAEALTVDTIVKAAVLKRYPYLTKMLAKFPQQSPIDFRQIYCEQTKAQKPRPPAPTVTSLKDYVFTILIKKDDEISVEWNGVIVDPEQPIQLWTDEEVPPWCIDSADEDSDRAYVLLEDTLKLDVLVSKMTPRGLCTIMLCRDSKVEETVHDSIIFEENLPCVNAASKLYALVGLTWLLRPWLDISKVGGGAMESIFRLDDPSDIPEVTSEQLLAYLEHAAPWDEDAP